MPSPSQDPGHRGQQASDSPLARLKRRWALDTHLGVRGLWWAMLDRLEASRRLRIGCLLGLLLAAGATAGLLWGYPWWQKRNAVRMAREWLTTDRIENTRAALQLAITTAPDNPETWELASQFAARIGQPLLALDYAQEAVKRLPGDQRLLVNWASSALVAGRLEVADEALGQLDPRTRTEVARVRRIEGELARQRRQLDLACAHFEAAINLEGPSPQNEIPLAETWLLSTSPELRAKGRTILEKWALDIDAAPLALRPLLTDALRRGDHPLLAKWAPYFRGHPRCTLGDVPLILQALSVSDVAEFETTIAHFAKHYAGDATSASQLIGWLNQIGRPSNALSFARTLPEAFLATPPGAVVHAESLRSLGDAKALLRFLHAGKWGQDTEFLRQAYLLQAFRELGLLNEATGAWKDLQALSKLNPAHALFAANSLYLWGLKTEAVELLWNVSEDAHVGFQALLTLARHYQTVRDAEGQYRVFRLLRSARPDTAEISNNFAFFAALLGREEGLALRLARENLEKQPGSGVFLSTYVFVLTMQSRQSEALSLLNKQGAGLPETEALRFARGIALARNGDKDSAARLLRGLPQGSLTRQEAELIESLLR